MLVEASVPNPFEPVKDTEMLVAPVERTKNTTL